MNNGATSGLSAEIEALPFFSAYLERAGVCPILRVNVSGFEKQTAGELRIRIAALCGENEFLNCTELKRRSFCPDSYNLKSRGSCVFEYSLDNISPDRAFLEALAERTEAAIYAEIYFGGEVCRCKTEITLLSNDTWAGLDCYAGALSAFVMPDDENIAAICGSDKNEPSADYARCSERELKESVKALYKSLKAKSIIYTRPAGYSAGALQRVRKPREMFSGASVLATPLELCLTFCACAERTGFDPAVLFVRGKTGQTHAFCALWLRESPAQSSVCEDSAMICECLKYGDLVAVEPGVFAAAQNTSFSLAYENAVRTILGAEASVVCLVDIRRARDAGITPIDSARKTVLTAEGTQTTVKNEVARLYASLLNKPEMKLLSGAETGRFTEIPLLLSDFGAFFKDDVSEYKLLPLDLNINLSDFYGEDDNFSSVLNSYTDQRRCRRTAAEKAAIASRIGQLKMRLSQSDGVTTALKEEALFDAAGKMAFETSGKRPFIAFGYVRITDKLTELVSHAPMCLVPAKLCYRDGAFYIKQSAKPIVNKVFIRDALGNASLSYDSIMKSPLPEGKNEIFDMFRSIIGALAESDDRFTYEIICEAHVICVDLSGFTLWSDLAMLRKRLYESRAVSYALGAARCKTEKSAKEIPAGPVFMQGDGMLAAQYKHDAVVAGYLPEEKLKTLLSLVKSAVTKGETVLVTAPDAAYAEYVTDYLCKNGLSDALFRADESATAKQAAEKISALLQKHSETASSNISDMPIELAGASAFLAAYEEKLKKAHPLGFSLYDALISYFEASEDASSDALYVDESIFEHASPELTDRLFTDAGTLITNARKLCAASDMPEYSPICEHALFGARPEKAPDEKEAEKISDCVSGIVPVLSEYRDVFADVSVITGIEQNSVTTLDALYALNGLYKLALSARDVEIPENLPEAGLERISNGVNMIADMEKRCEAIRFRLPFFTPELFEDIETVLVGDRYEDAEKGFLKRFVKRKNGEDILLQYVDGKNLAAFRARPIDEIYRLLYEYKACVKHINRASDEYGEFPRELANLAAEIKGLLERIYGEGTDVSARIAGVFRLISVIPVDSALARGITVSRAHLAEVFSDGVFSLGAIGKKLGIDFGALRFENGILAFDGLADYLKKLVKNLDVTDKWIKWTSDARRISETLPSFVEYIERHGAGGNADRIFAKSLLMPAAKRIKEDFLPEGELNKVNTAKDKYIALMKRACALADANFDTAISQSVRHQSETCRKESISADGKESLREYYGRNRKLFSKVLPCIVTSADVLTAALPSDAVFDVSAVIDAAEFGMCMLPALSLGKRAQVFNMSAMKFSRLSKGLEESGVKTFDVGRVCAATNPELFFYLNSAFFSERAVITGAEKTAAETVLIRINGFYDRGKRRINHTEAELALSKAVELLSVYKDEIVAVSAFTNEMCVYMQRLAHIVKKKSPVLLRALSENRIVFTTPDRLCMTGCGCAVLCACFGSDKASGIVRDFCLAEPNGSYNAYISLCGAGLKKLFVITCMNAKESRALGKTGAGAYAFNRFCEFLSDGRIPVCASVSDSENSLVPGFLGALGKNTRFVSCMGKDACGASLMSADKRLFVFADGETDIHNELLLKDAADVNAETMTLSVAELAGKNSDSLLEAFRKREE